MLAKICAIGFRLDRFLDLSSARTQVARLNAIVLSWDRDRFPVFQLIFDSPSASYLWKTLLDVGAEDDARPAGLNSITRVTLLDATSEVK
jgi:sarcosine oxidase gamma subunit